MNNGVIKITIANFVIVTLMSWAGITIVKLFLAKHYVDGLSELAAQG